MDLVWNKEKLSNMLLERKQKIALQYSPLLQLDINALNSALGNDEYTPVQAKKNNTTSNEFYKAIKEARKIKIDRNYYESKYRDIDQDEVIKMTRTYLSPGLRKYLDKLIKEAFIDFSYKQDSGTTFYLPSSKINIIGVNYDGTLSSARILFHELGHALDWLRIDSLDATLNYGTSNFKEMFAILNELQFLDVVNLPKEEVKKEQYNFLNNYSVMLNNETSNSQYNQSFLLAQYLFYLSKEDKNKYKEYVERYKEYSKQYTDDEIIKKLEITSDDMVHSYKTYVKRYSSR